MKIYVYSKDGKVINVSREAGECFTDAWYDFKARHNWKEFYEQETEEDAFVEFCDDLVCEVYSREFEVTEWDLG